MKCARPWECASARACATADAEQQLRSASFSGSDHSSSVTATVSSDRAHNSAATALSTPPLIATSVRVAAPAGARSEPRSRAAAPSARASASAASSAACSLPGLRPPSSAAMRQRPTRAASSTPRPRTSVTAALAAAVAEPQPWASKPASSTRSSETLTEKRIWSQHAPPPAITVKSSAGVRPSPCGRSDDAQTRVCPPSREYLRARELLERQLDGSAWSTRSEISKRSAKPTIVPAVRVRSISTSVGEPLIGTCRVITDSGSARPAARPA